MYVLVESLHGMPLSSYKRLTCHLAFLAMKNFGQTNNGRHAQTGMCSFKGGGGLCLSSPGLP